MLELKKGTLKELDRVVEDMKFQRELKGEDAELSMDEVVLKLINAYWDLQSLKAQLRTWDGLETGYLKVVAEGGNPKLKELDKRPNFYELWCKGAWPYND